MILTALAAYGIGLGQVFLVSFQVRQIAAGHRGLGVFLTSCGISGVWVLGVHSVVASPLTAPCYVLGAACGTMIATRVRLREGGRRVRSERLPRALRDERRVRNPVKP